MKDNGMFGNGVTSTAKDLARSASEASKPASPAPATTPAAPSTKSDSEMAARAMDIRPKRTF